MATESPAITARSITLLDAWVQRTRLPWPYTIVAVGLILVLLLVSAAYLDGVLARPFDIDFWQDYLLAPTMIVYILSTYYILHRYF